MSGKIEPRFGAEVYLTVKGWVCIKQERHEEQEEAIILLHPDEVSEVIEHLESTRQEALDFVPDPEPDERQED